MTLIEAIAKMEGEGKSGAIPTRNNNPGDIVWGGWARVHGAVGNDGRYAKFLTLEAGYAALRALLIEHYVGLTVEAAINKFAPPVENDTNHYIDLVCGWTGLTPKTVITAEIIG